MIAGSMMERRRPGRGRSWRGFFVLAATALLAACGVAPRGPRTPVPAPTEAPSEVLPTDTARHRIALLVPMSGPNGAVGQSIANASTMALLDTNAQNLRVTTYDTSAGADAAIRRAIGDGNRLILGPLLSQDVAAVAASARAAKAPVIAFSNDASAAARGVYVMGTLPGASIARSVAHARAQGLTRFAALVPVGEYGERASAALFASVREAGGVVVASETYERNNASAVGAARRLRDKGGFEAVLIADGGRIAAQAAPALSGANGKGPRIIGTELWSGEAIVTSTPELRGAWFAAAPDTRFGQFSNSYRNRFGGQPYRIATLGYDSVLLALRVARDWKPGSAFPTGSLTEKGGFLGLDGAFRFARNGLVERALEVRQVRAGGFDVVSPAPTRFQD